MQIMEEKNYIAREISGEEAGAQTGAELGVVACVARADVMSKVELITSYIAGKQKDDAAGFDKVSAIEADAELIRQFFEEAALGLSVAFADRLSAFTLNDSATFAFAPGCVAEVFSASAITALLESILTHRVASRWLLTIGETVAAENEEAMIVNPTALLESVVNTPKEVAKPVLASLRPIPPF